MQAKRRGGEQWRAREGVREWEGTGDRGRGTHRAARSGSRSSAAHAARAAGAQPPPAPAPAPSAASTSRAPSLTSPARASASHCAIVSSNAPLGTVSIANYSLMRSIVYFISFALS